jgi:hypothetical protein
MCQLTSFSQKQKVEYSPVTGTNLEEAFPLATNILMESLGLGLYQFDYGSRILKTSYYEYYRGITRHRGRWQLSIDENGTLDIQIVDIQWWYGSQSRWDDTGEGLFSKKEQKLRAALAEDIRNNLENKETVKEAQNWFFTNLEVNAKFYESATDLAGDRWFDNYLKDQRVDWNLTFIDIEKNSNSASNFKYKETYTYATTLSLGSISFEDSKFFITKYTNKDNNVLTKKGDSRSVLGYCRSIRYDDGKFYVILTDELEDALPVNTLAKQERESDSNSILEVADQLKKLKELLDLGAISQEEYDAEKAKLLNN